MCTHHPHCPPPDATDAAAARTVASHPEQGWSRLCNGLIAFDDLGLLLPDGRETEFARNRPLTVAAA